MTLSVSLAKINKTAYKHKNAHTHRSELYRPQVYYLICRTQYYLSLKTDYQLMVVSSGTNPISYITFLAVHMNFTFLSSNLSTLSMYYKSFFFSRACICPASLFLHPSLPVFPGNYFMALLVTVGRLPQVYGPC